MKQTFSLFIVVVFLFGVAVVHGTAVAELRDIVCSDASSISFDIYIPDITQWEGSADQRSWSLNDKDDEACQPTFDEDNGLVSYSNINVAICADDPDTTPDNSKFEYVFEISVTAEAGSTIDPVTFAYDHEYVVKCFYNREQNDLMASFQPRHSLTDTGSGVNDFIIDFTVHKADDDSEVTGIIDLRTAVYGKIRIESTDGLPVALDLDVHLEKVTADKDNTPGGEFSLLTDGCGESSIVSAITCNEDEEDRFYFEIFRFPGQSEPDEVYLRAKVIVCLRSNSASECRDECSDCSTPRHVSLRKRRDTLEEIQQTEFYVTAGPIKIRDPNQDSEAAAGEDKETEGTPFPAYMIAVVAVCGLLAIATVSAVVLIVFHRRRKNVANVELRNEVSVTA